MDMTRRGRRSRRKRALIVVAGAVVIAAAFLACLLLRYGIDGVVYFFTTPTMEARSGRKYTPVSGVKRAIERLDKKSTPQE